MTINTTVRTTASTGRPAVPQSIQLLSPWVLKFAIDDLTAGVTRRKLAFYAGTMLGIACVGAIFRYLMRQILIGASRDIEYDLRNEFFARLQQMPLAYYQAATSCRGRPTISTPCA